MGKFKLFLEQSKFESKIINDSELISCEVSKRSKVWTLNIKLKEVVSVADLKPFLANLKSYFLIIGVVNEIKVKLQYEKSKRLSDYQRDYFEYVINEIAKDKPRYLAFLSFKVEYLNIQFTLIKIVHTYLVMLIILLKSLMN